MRRVPRRVSCNPNGGVPWQRRRGGGWYTASGIGRVNFGLTVRKVPNTTNVYKGQILLINNGKWRLEGTLDS